MKMEKIEAGLRAILAFNRAFNRQDVTGMMPLFSEDCVFESSGPIADGAVYSGKEAISQFWQNFFRQSPRARMEIEHTFGFGIQCVMRWQYFWVDAAGEEKHIRGVDIFMFKNGLISEQLSYVKDQCGNNALS